MDLNKTYRLITEIIICMSGSPAINSVSLQSILLPPLSVLFFCPQNGSFIQIKFFHFCFMCKQVHEVYSCHWAVKALNMDKERQLHNWLCWRRILGLLMLNCIVIRDLPFLQTLEQKPLSLPSWLNYQCSNSCSHLTFPADPVWNYM